jgi:hypothetical protein
MKLGTWLRWKTTRSSVFVKNKLKLNFLQPCHIHLTNLFIFSTINCLWPWFNSKNPYFKDWIWQDYMFYLPVPIWAKYLLMTFAVRFKISFLSVTLTLNRTHCSILMAGSIQMTSISIAQLMDFVHNFNALNHKHNEHNQLLCFCGNSRVQLGLFSLKLHL